MRIRTFAISIALLAPLASLALADPQSHCEIYSKDFADGRTANVDKWQLLYRGAFDDCMKSYNAQPTVDAPLAVEAEPAAVEVQEETPVKKPAVRPKARKAAAKKATSRVAARNLIPGSEAWNSFCAAKYSSFNKQSGTYLSNSGKIRRCSTTR